MSEKKGELLNLIMNQNVSAVQTLADRLEITFDEVIELIKALLEEGTLKGTLTEDGVRFFRSEIKLSAAPTIPRDESPPDFMNFNTQPGRVTAILGFILIAAGVIINANALDVIEQNFAALLILLGMVIVMSGLYCISRRKTPA